MEPARKKITERPSRAHFGEVANDLLAEGKKYAHDVYNQGLKKVNKAEKEFNYYSTRFLDTIEKHPFASVFIAGSLGFFLSKLFRK